MRDNISPSPEHGIVWAYRFSPEGKARKLPPDEVSGAVADAGPGWVWIHLALADIRCRAWIEQIAPVSDYAREVLTSPDNYLRLDMAEDELIGILPDLQQELAEPGEALVRLRFVLTDRIVITARQQPVHSAEVTRRSVDAGREFETPVSLLDAVIDEFADTITRLAHHYDEQLDDAEDAVLRDEIGEERVVIGRIRMHSVRVHRQLAQLRILFHRLEPRLANDEGALACAVRALAQKLDATDLAVRSLQERCRLLLEEVAAKMTAVTNRRLFTISVLTACILPPTLVTGFFGMNTKHLPFQETDGGTWLALLVAVAAGLVSVFLLRRMKAF